MPKSRGKPPMPRPDPKPAILRLTDAFCAGHFAPEAAGLCRLAAERLDGKSPSPLLRGSPEWWAAGILHAVAAVNCLFGPWRGGPLTVTQIADACGVSLSTVAARGRAVSRLLRIKPGDPAWLLPGAEDHIPLHVTFQRMIDEARRKG